MVGTASSLRPDESHNSRGAGWLCWCQELIQSPVKQPVSCAVMSRATVLKGELQLKPQKFDQNLNTI